jgi:DMSO/TMAO reductase YedYZ molybdopterin-dependent catalytic subunit
MDEREYDGLRLSQWRAGVAGGGFTRRDLARLAAGLSAAALVAGVPSAAHAAGPIVKPLPPEWFTIRGTNAEMRWEAMADRGYLVPVDRFFVRNHTSTPVIGRDTWRLELFGTGLRAPTSFTYRDLRRMPSTTLVSAVECAGNGRSFYTTQQGQTVSGTAWTLGAVGVARWRGVRLSTVLRRAGITPEAVDVQPEGLDPHYVTGGVDLGPVRRPLPVSKALDDVLLAYEMNGEPLPPDHGHPVRVIVPSWIGISSIKWVGRIEVSASPLFSPWNTQFYRLLGPAYPADGTLIGEQVVKSAFELPWDAVLAAGQRHVLRGRSWSGHGRIRRVEVSTDGGTTWRPAHPVGPSSDVAWQRWEFPWRPTTAGAYTVRARATDATGATQPARSEFNTQGYLFDGVVAHPVTVA